MVGNVQVQNFSVEVTWDPPPLTTGIVGFRVYYSQVQSRKRQSEEGVEDVDGLVSSATITGLSRGVQYQFQVAVRARLNGEIFEGERSAISEDSMITLTAIQGGAIGTVIGAIVFTIGTVSLIVLVVMVVWCLRRFVLENS